MSVTEDAGVVEPTVLSYLWKIENFSEACKSIEDCLHSPVFSTMYLSIKDDWRIHLYPKGRPKERLQDLMLIYLKYLGQRNAEVHVTFSLLNDNYCKVFEGNFERIYQPGSLGHGASECVLQKFVIDESNRILVDDTIKILCEIIYDPNLAKPLVCEEEKSPGYCRLEEFDEFEKLLDAENSTDVTIVIGEKKLQVHKAIIVNRSPVFQAMFEHDMKEKELNTVEIIDVEYEVMKEVCRFMYAGKVNGVEKIAGALLMAADKYSIKGLKALCEKQLIDELKIENVIEYLKLADICKVDNLKSKVIKFIVSNLKDVVHKSELNLLPAGIVCEVLRAIADDSK